MPFVFSSGSTISELAPWLSRAIFSRRKSRLAQTGAVGAMAEPL
jgi:hypothetical protein